MDKKGKTLLMVGCGVVAASGLCCVSAGGVGLVWMQREAEEEATRFVAEMQRMEAAEELERTRRVEETRVAEQAAMLAPPMPLSIRPRRSRDRRPRTITASVTAALGRPGVSVGDACNFDVTVHDSDEDPGYWCRALVECGGRRLYGQDFEDGRGNGYFPCELRRRPKAVSGEDRETTTDGTGDPFMQIDTRAGQLVVIDDDTTQLGEGAFRVEAAIIAVN